MSDNITRRQFAGTLAVGSSLALSAAACTDEGRKTDAEKKEAAPRTDETQKKPQDQPEAQSTLELIVQIAKQDYPHEKLDAAAIDEIRSDVAGNLRRSKVLSAFPLQNSDEPGFAFAAWRKDPV